MSILSSMKNKSAFVLTTVRQQLKRSLIGTIGIPRVNTTNPVVSGPVLCVFCLLDMHPIV